MVVNTEHPDGRDRAVLFDFFGTLVAYQPDRGRLAYPETYRLLSSWRLVRRRMATPSRTHRRRSGHDQPNRKPHPSIYRAALAELGVEAERTVFVGDSFSADYTGSAALNMTSYLIDPEQRHDVPPDRRMGTVLDIESKLDQPGPR